MVGTVYCHVTARSASMPMYHVMREREDSRSLSELSSHNVSNIIITIRLYSAGEYNPEDAPIQVQIYRGRRNNVTIIYPTGTQWNHLPW